MIDTLLKKSEIVDATTIPLKVGLRLSVSADESINNLHLSRIEAVKKGELHISMPMNRGVVMPLVVGNCIYFSFIVNNSRYAFKSVVLFFTKSSVHIAVIRYPEKIYGVDFRGSFRVAIEHLVKIFTMSDSKIDFSDTTPTFYANCIDLSATGARLATRSDLTRYTEFHIDISSLVQGLGLIGSTIVWHEKIDEFFHFGVKFFGMRDIDRDVVTKYLFKKQTELRRNSRRGL